MKPIQFISTEPKIAFMRRRRIAFVFSALLVVVSIVAGLTEGLNFGIDFRGGVLIEVQTKAPADLSSLRSTLGGLGLGEVQIQGFGGPDIVLIRVQRQEGGDAAQQSAINAVRAAIGDVVQEYRRTEFVGPTVGAELIRAAILAISLALGAILVYVWFRFEWQFGVGAVVALLHDVITTVGLFAITQLEFNLSTVAAVLTIAGYSINDTVVIYDRVRETLRKYKKRDLESVLDIALNSTLSRTLLTSFTTLLALIALVALGGPIIRNFAYAMIWGVVIGTYSSIFVATPILLRLNLRAITASSGSEGAKGETGKQEA